MTRADEFFAQGGLGSVNGNCGGIGNFPASITTTGIAHVADSAVVYGDGDTANQKQFEGVFEASATLGRLYGKANVKDYRDRFSTYCVRDDTATHMTLTNLVFTGPDGATQVDNVTFTAQLTFNYFGDATYAVRAAYNGNNVLAVDGSASGTTAISAPLRSFPLNVPQSFFLSLYTQNTAQSLGGSFHYTESEATLQFPCGPVFSLPPGYDVNGSGIVHNHFVNGTVTNMFPDHGIVGTSVTLDGCGFNATTNVSFNGTSASFTIISDWQIVTTVPQGATSGPIIISSPLGDYRTTTFTVDALYWENFDEYASPSTVTTSGTANGYKIFFNAASGAQDFTAIFGFDYSTVTTPYAVPAAPHSVGGTTKGLYLTANKDATGAAAAVNLYPVGQSFSNNFALKFDMWINYGSANTTEHALFGINHSGLWTNRIGKTTSDGLFFAVDGDGGITSTSTTVRDYAVFRGRGSGTTPLLMTTANTTFGPAPLLGANFDASDAGFQNQFPLFNFDTSAGIVGGQWMSVEVRQETNTITWFMHDTLIAQYTNTYAYTNGNIMIGYNDTATSIGDPANFVIIDNLRVVSLPSAPSVMAPSITMQPSSQTVNAGTAVNFSVTASGTAPLTYQWRRNGTNLSDGVNVTGAGTANLTIGNAQIGDTGTYDIVVSNAGGTATSSGATLHVKQLATVTLGNLLKTYNIAGSVTVTTIPSGLPYVLTYDGSATVPTQIGTYVVEATIDDANYFGTASATYVIRPYVTGTGFSTTYDGTPKPVSVFVSPSSVSYEVSYYDSLSSAYTTVPPTDAGTYSVMVEFDDPRFEPVFGTLNIEKALAQIQVGNLSQYYDGIAKPVSVTVDPPDFAYTVSYRGEYPYTTYGPSYNAPTNAGIYEIWVGGDFDNKNYYYITPIVDIPSLQILPQPTAITFGNLQQQYDGSAKTVTTFPSGVSVSVTYNGSATPPIAIGSYTVVATVTNPNYTGGGSATLIITPPVNGSYSGNHATGFGGGVGNGALSLTNDFTTIHGQLTLGSGTLDNVLVFYIDTGANGFTSTANFTDDGDDLRRAISGTAFGNRSTMTFATGFTPSHVIALGPAAVSFGGLWQLTENGSHTYLTSVNIAPTGNNTGPYTFALPMSALGISAGQTIRLFGTVISTSAYRSDETIAGNASGTQGWNAFTQTSFRTYTVTAVTPPEVTFQVDMTAQNANGAFEPNNGDTVSAAGTFQTSPWVVHSFVLTNNPTAPNPNIYSGVYTDAHATGTVEEYKFIITRNVTDNWESTANRTFAVQSDNQTLPLVYFGNLAPSSGVPTHATTFQVDMSVQAAISGFNPQTDTVEVRGSFQTPAQWSGGFVLTNDPNAANPYLYLGTYADGNYPGTIEEYKFVINGSRFESTANRTFTVSPTEQTLSPVFFDDLNSAVTFSVDMSAEVSGGTFNPLTDSVEVRGSFNGFNDGLTLTKAVGSNVYSRTVGISDAAGTTEQYKFYASPSVLGYETPKNTQGENRTFTLSDGAQVLPVVNFGDLTEGDLLAADTLVTFSVDMAGAVGTDAHAFQTGDSLFVNGDFLGWWTWGAPPAENQLSNTFSSVYSVSLLVPRGRSSYIAYKYGINGFDNEAAFGSNHFAHIVGTGSYTLPVDKFGTSQTRTLASVSLTNLVQTFDGSEKVASVLTEPANLSVTVTYDGETNPPTNAGSYAVVATITDPAFIGTATETFVIEKANGLISVTGLSQTYDGTPRPITATTTPSGLPVTILYDGSPTPPTIPGDYDVVVSIDDTNYAGTRSATLTITADPPAVTTQPVTQTINAGAQLALSVTATGYGAFTYQWSKNGVPLLDGSTNAAGGMVSDATTSMLTISNVIKSDEGTYAVTVTGSGSTVSSNAVITVIDPVIVIDPVDTTVLIGDPALLTVDAAGTPYANGQLRYQWYRRVGLTSSALAGQTNQALTFGAAAVANEGDYFVTVSNIFSASQYPGTNVAVSSVAHLSVLHALAAVNVAPPLLQPIAGKTVKYTATAGPASAGPFHFQWTLNGTEIPGATNSVYTRTNVQAVDAGTYQCIAINNGNSTLQSPLSQGVLVVKPDDNNPIIQILGPANNARLLDGSTITGNGGASAIAPDCAINGKAIDSGLVTSVFVAQQFYDDNGVLQQLDPAHADLYGTQGNQYWTNLVRLRDGTNIFNIYAYDTASNRSDIVTRKLLLVRHATLTVNIVSTDSLGIGTSVPGPTPSAGAGFGQALNNAALEIGRNYTLKAVPGLYSFCTNITDGAGNVLASGTVKNQPLITFRMTEGKIINCNFAQNPVVRAGITGGKGVFNGLFAEASGVKERSAGYVEQLIVQTNLTYSGKFYIDGKSYILSDKFDLGGWGHSVLTRSQSGKTDLDITLRLDLLNNSKQITGVISNMSASDPWTAPLTNDLAGLYLNLNGSYTVAFSPDSPPLTSPVGFSVLTITNNPTGTMRVLNGRLADGAPFTFSVPISRLGYAPVSTRLYRDSSGNYHGLLHGNLHFSGIAGPVTGKLNWIRSTSPTALPALYSAGFTNTDMNVIGSYYAPPAPGNGALNVGNGTILAGPCDIGLQSAYNWIVAINGNNTLTRTAGDSGFKSCTIQPAVGLCTLRFRPIGISTDIVGTGVIIQNNGIILGFFPGLHQAGEFVLSRSP